MLDEFPNFAPLTVPARRFASVWCDVTNATGDAKEDFTTYRTVTLEVFPEQGVRLLCMNASHSLLLRGFVPLLHLVDEDGDAWYDQPGLDERPSQTVICRDLDKALGQMMKRLLSAKPVDKDDDDDSADRWPLTIAPGHIEPEGVQPTLAAMFDEFGVVFTSPRSQQSVAVLEESVAAPDWRHVESGFDLGAVFVDSWAPENWKAVSNVSCDERGIQHEKQGPEKPTRLTMRSKVSGTINGLLMPLRRPAQPDDDDTPVSEPERSGAQIDHTWHEDPTEGPGADKRRPVEDMLADGASAGDILRHGSGLLTADMVPAASFDPDDDKDEAGAASFLDEITGDAPSNVAEFPPPGKRTTRKPRGSK